MPASSVTTLLGATNRILAAVGERPVTSLRSPVALLASNILKDVTYELSTVHDWSWARDKIPATTWVLDTATLTNVARVWDVLTGDPLAGSYVKATFLDKTTFDTLALDDYNSTTNVGWYPRYWTIEGHNEVRVNPFPTDATAQAKVLFDVTKILVPPTVATGTFPIPEQYLNILLYKAEAVLALEHLNDAESAAQFTALFETTAQRARQFDGLHPAKHLTMARRGRTRYYL